MTNIDAEDRAIPKHSMRYPLAYSKCWPGVERLQLFFGETDMVLCLVHQTVRQLSSVFQQRAVNIEDEPRRHAGRAVCIAPLVVRQKQSSLDVYKRQLYDRADRLDRYILLHARLDDILLVVQANVRTARRNHTHRVIRARGRLDVNRQSFLSKVTGLLSLIQERMQRVRIPVEHDGQLTQFPVGLRLSLIHI